MEALKIDQKQRRIAIVSTNKQKYSETFIQAQIEQLPYQVFLLHSGYLPTKYGKNDELLIPEISTGNYDEQTLKSGIKDFLKRNKIELVLAQYGPSGVKMRSVCEELNIPLVVYFRGYDAYRQDMLDTFGMDYPKLFETASAIFVVSKAMQQQLEKLGAPSEKIYYNPSGANMELFDYHDAGKNPVTFLASGRFEASKSHHLTILSFSKAFFESPEAKLILVGDGHLKEACQILVKALKLEDAVEFKGVVPHKEVAGLMAQSRAFVQHSITTPSNDTEGTPVAIMEASASGLPVISTLHAGIPEVVEHRKTGFLVEEGDVEGMAKYMIEISLKPGLATQMGKAGHEKICAKYTTQKNIERLTAVIDQLLKEKAS